MESTSMVRFPKKQDGSRSFYGSFKDQFCLWQIPSREGFQKRTCHHLDDYKKEGTIVSELGHIYYTSFSHSSQKVEVSLKLRTGESIIYPHHCG